MPGPVYETCASCGLVQVVPDLARHEAATCVRCDHVLARGGARRPHDHTASFAAALAGLLLYPFAILLPIMELERLGNRSEASIWSGSVGLLGDGQWFVGGIVLLCSVVLPLGKLLSLMTLSSCGERLTRRHRLITWRAIEWTGRWGMLDVLLIAVLVAWVKLGDLVEIRTGPAAIAFTACVLASLVAAAAFDPTSFWEAADEPRAEDAA